MKELKKLWAYLKKDTIGSWALSLVLLFILIKFIIFPVLSLLTGSSLPLVVVESCSMYHSAAFDDWWYQNGAWYEQNNISKSEFQSYGLSHGLNKGDIVLVTGDKEPKKGDIIIFTAGTEYPIIHRIITSESINTKGDNNLGQLSIEHNISKESILGKASAKVPYIGWIKLIFFEPFKPASQRGFCS